MHFNVSLWIRNSVTYKSVIRVVYRVMSKRSEYRSVAPSRHVITMFHRKIGILSHGNASVVLKMNCLFYMLSLSPALPPTLVQQESEDVSADDWCGWRSEMRAPPPSSLRASHAFSQVNTPPPPSSFCVCVCICVCVYIYLHEHDLPTVILVCRLSISTKTLFSTTATRATRIYVRLMSNTIDVPGKVKKPHSHNVKWHN